MSSTRTFLPEKKQKLSSWKHNITMVKSKQKYKIKRVASEYTLLFTISRRPSMRLFGYFSTAVLQEKEHTHTHTVRKEPNRTGKTFTMTDQHYSAKESSKKWQCMQRESEKQKEKLKDSLKV